MTLLTDRSVQAPPARNFKPGSVLSAALLSTLVATALYLAVAPAIASALLDLSRDSLAVRNARAHQTLASTPR